MYNSEGPAILEYKASKKEQMACKERFSEVLRASEIKTGSIL